MNINAQDVINNDGFDYLVRHYKIIKRNDYNSHVTKTKIVTDKSTGQVICNNITNEAELTYNFEDYLSQDTDNFNNVCNINYIILNNPYNEVSVIDYCNDHNKYTLNGKHYNDISDIKTDINNVTNESNERFINEIINSNFDETEKTSLKNYINNYINGNSNELYIRMAPNKSEKEALLERIIYLQNIDPEYYMDGEEKIYANDGVPVYNDHIIYSTLKYETITKSSVKEILGIDDDNLNKKIEEL